MNYRINDEELNTRLAFIDGESSENAGSTYIFDDARILLIDIINPQPKSSKSFYARINSKKMLIRQTNIRIKRTKR